MKVHEVDSGFARNFADTHHTVCKELRRFFHYECRKAISASIVAALAEAKKVRDKVVHAMNATGVAKRKMAVCIIQYA